MNQKLKLTVIHRGIRDCRAYPRHPSAKQVRMRITDPTPERIYHGRDDKQIN